MLLCMGFLAPSFCIFISLLPISIPSAAIIMFACALNRQIAPWTLAFYTPALYPSLFKLPSVNFNPSLKDIHLTRPISSSPSLATTSTTTLTLPPSHCQSMEPQNPHHHHPPQEDASNLAGCGNGVAGSKTSFLCRQSSTRWIPTSDQIRILRDLYYNNGLRSPNAEQIQRISARLRQYGKIEGKNVFYWFQNHKARERQKKRLTVDIATAANSGFTTKSFPSTSRSPGLYSAGQIGNDVYHGSALAETSFRESCMAAGSVSGNAISAGYWAAASAPDAWVHHGASDRAANAIISREIETLQLFPINAVKQGGVEEDAEEEEDHGADAEYYTYSGGPSHLLTKDDNKISNLYCCSSQQPEQHQPQHSLYSLSGSTNATTYDVAADSLELTLNSYYGHV